MIANSASEMVPSAREMGEGVGFDRIRRITGYLVGTLDRFNNGKAAEERDRVKHGLVDTSNRFDAAIYSSKVAVKEAVVA